MNTSLRGIFLTSEQPALTARFYRDVAGLPLEQVGQEGSGAYWKTDDRGVQLAIHDAQAFAPHTFPARADSNLTHLYFKIDSRQEFLGHLKGMGIVPCSADDVVVTVLDPDGRKVMFGTA